MTKFETLTKTLNHAMLHEYDAVNKYANSIYRRREELSEAQLTDFLGQYSLFPARIVSYLENAKGIARNYGWHAIDVELKRNIGEELGSDTDGITHYQMLLTGVKESAGIDLAGVLATRGTEDFLQAMMHHTKCSDHPAEYVIGATYALESSAVPELEIVVDLTRELVERRTAKFEMSHTLERFFDDHLHTWEVGHESRLRDACAEDIEFDAMHRALENFEAGFRGTLYSMDMWWAHLAYGRMKL